MALRDLTRKLTYEDYALIPEDGQRHEILDGAHYVTPSPIVQHQLISSKLHCAIGPFVFLEGLGVFLSAPMDVLLSRHDIVQPDLLFISKEKAGIISEENIRGAPDLVIEILSGRTRRRDEGIKLERYDRCGVREYWIFDPGRKTVRVFRRQRERLRLVTELSAGNVLTSSLLPGLEIRLTNIFE